MTTSVSQSSPPIATPPPLLQYRYSTGPSLPTTAPPFPWELPIPITPFWNSFPYPTARNILLAFPENPEQHSSEINGFKVEKYNDANHEEKCRFLSGIVREKIAALEEEDKGLFEKGKEDGEKGKTKQEEEIADEEHKLQDKTEPKFENLNHWRKSMQALTSLLSELKLLEEEITVEERILTVNTTVSSYQTSTVPISAQSHNLAHLLTLRSSTSSSQPADLPKAEELASSALPWFEEHLGRDSPQALAVRRTIIAAVWKQGGVDRREEAERMVDEMRALIVGMKKRDGVEIEGKYGVYAEEEERLVDELVEELRGWEGKRE